jgi:hypothetical protein
VVVTQFTLTGPARFLKPLRRRLATARRAPITKRRWPGRVVVHTRHCPAAEGYALTPDDTVRKTYRHPARIRGTNVLTASETWRTVSNLVVPSHVGHQLSVHFSRCGAFSRIDANCSPALATLLPLPRTGRFSAPRLGPAQVPDRLRGHERGLQQRALVPNQRDSPPVHQMAPI